MPSLAAEINLCSLSVEQSERATGTEPGRDEKGGGRAPRSWSAPKLQHEPFSGTSWASCRARGRVYVPPLFTAPAPTRRKSLPNTEPERRTRSDGCSSSSSSSSSLGLCLRRRARERHQRWRNGRRAHPIFKRTIIYAHCLRVSPRGQSLHQSALTSPCSAAVFPSVSVVVVERGCRDRGPPPAVDEGREERTVKTGGPFISTVTT